MKKIGILTFHFADNYGAVLQCYALRRVINGITRCRAEVINYVPASFRYVKTWTNEYEESLFQEKRKNFVKFLSEHCGIQKPMIHTISEAGPYDYYVVGSDQVWSTGMQEYFLPEIAEKNYCISYAASIGVGMDNPRLKKSVLQQYVPKFTSVSVREYEHVAFIEKMCGKKCECLLDPVLLLNAVDYEGFVAKESLREERFIFFFWLTHDKEYMHGVEFVNRLSRLLEIPIVHAFHFAPDYMFCNDGGSMQFEGIENFLWYTKNAEYVVTNSYHATLFSIQFHTPFYIFASKNMHSRIDTLCKRFAIHERVVEGYLPMDKVSKDIDFDFIYRKILEQREDSFQYLRKALEAAYE
ncbi:MAG: polysaccharide pyruvyl transferase family protein [Lachnospiraceae bacterium]|nr:polysaccharide pyruvyl transferase family protein [Lachnospiraceae bacterium]